MNRAQRRRAARDEARSSPPPLCPTGTHAFAQVSGTVDGKVVAVRILCTTCRRTFEQVMEEDPAELARYRAFLEAERDAGGEP